MPQARLPGSVTAWLDVGGQLSANFSFAYYIATGVFPPFAPARGGVNITVTGVSFIALTGDASIRLTNSTGGATVTLAASVMNSSTVVAFLGSTRGTGIIGPASVSLTLNGGRQWSEVPGTVTVYEDPRVEATAPRSGPLSGRTQLTLAGFFPNTGRLAARIDTAVLPCVYVSETALNCTTPNTTTEALASISVSVDLDANNLWFSAVTANFFYYIPPHVNVSDPPLLPIAVPSSFAVLGSVGHALDSAGG